jgi:desulfoferrodoxin (superoxide reductase-like protein)
MWHKTVQVYEVKELPPVARKLFLRFYNVAGGSITHPNDHERFNEFIRFCYAKHVKLGEYQFERLLLKIGCKKGQAKRLSELYFNGRELLKSRCP